MGWGSGTAPFPYLISPLEALQARSKQDRTNVNWFLDNYDLDGAVAAVQGSDVAVSSRSVLMPEKSLMTSYTARFRQRRFG